jgi:hypothetical protein
MAETSQETCQLQAKEQAVKNLLKNPFCVSKPQSQGNDSDQGPTWEQVFANVPTAPGTETQQQRHKELRAKGDQMTEEDEAELNQLFEAIYPQFGIIAGIRRILDAIDAHPTYTPEEETYVLSLLDLLGDARAQLKRQAS